MYSILTIAGMKQKKDPNELEEEKKAGRQHLEFCMKLYNNQIDGGRYFLHEHPLTATSWKEKSVTDTMKREGVVKVRSDMCKFGMYQENEKGVEFVKKLEGFMTNAPEIAEELKGRCTGAHTYASNKRKS